MNFKNFIAGQWVEAASCETFDNINPADEYPSTRCFGAGFAA